MKSVIIRPLITTTLFLKILLVYHKNMCRVFLAMHLENICFQGFCITYFDTKSQIFLIRKAPSCFAFSPKGGQPPRTPLGKMSRRLSKCDFVKIHCYNQRFVLSQERFFVDEKFLENGAVHHHYQYKYLQLSIGVPQMQLFLKIIASFQKCFSEIQVFRS